MKMQTVGGIKQIRHDGYGLVPIEIPLDGTLDLWEVRSDDLPLLCLCAVYGEPFDVLERPLTPRNGTWRPEGLTPLLDFGAVLGSNGLLPNPIRGNIPVSRGQTIYALVHNYDSSDWRMAGVSAILATLAPALHPLRPPDSERWTKLCQRAWDLKWTVTQDLCQWTSPYRCTILHYALDRWTARRLGETVTIDPAQVQEHLRYLRDSNPRGYPEPPTSMDEMVKVYRQMLT